MKNKSLLHMTRSHLKNDFSVIPTAKSQRTRSMSDIFEMRSDAIMINSSSRFIAVLAFLFVMISGFISAQQVSIAEATTAIREVNAAYANAKNLKMDVAYSLFADYTTTAVFEKQNGVFMKQGNNTYSDLLGIVSLRNSRMSLTLDSNEQSIVVADPPSKKDLEPGVADLDSAMKICTSVEYRDMGKVKFYKLRFDRVLFSEYNAIDIYINSETHFLERLTLYFRAEIDLDETDDNNAKEKPRLEIVYSSISTQPVFTSGQFSESRFVSGTGKSIACAPAYSEFRLINNKLH